MAKFCANISFMFTELPFLERYSAAKKAGFKAVESGFPFGFSVDEVLKAKQAADIDQVLINIFTGDVVKGELGFAAIIGKEDEFKQSLSKTIDYAKALSINKIHIMAGKLNGPATNENDRCYESNLRYAVDLLSKEKITAVIEPINIISIPMYYLNCYYRAQEVIKKINSPNLRLMVDIFHMQHIRGNVTNSLKEFHDIIGHVQIAQVPNRGEPNTDGELNYPYILKKIVDQHGYTDWIGLEYKPEDGTIKGLKWINEYNYIL